MLTISKKSFRAPADDKKWLEELWAVTDEKQKFLAAPNASRYRNVRSKWLGEVNKSSDIFELTLKNAGLFKTAISRFTIYGEIKEGIVSKTVETRIELNWNFLTHLFRPLFLILVLREGMPDTFGLLLSCCIVALEILFLIYAFHQTEETFAEIIEDPKPRGMLSFR